MGLAYGSTSTACPAAVVHRPRESVTRTSGVKVPACRMIPVSPVRPSTVCPANCTRQDRTLLPRTPAAVTWNPRRLYPRTHTPHPAMTALSFTTWAARLAVGFTSSGTYSFIGQELVPTTLLPE